MKYYDVIIAGAGPAGLSCAIHLIDSGLKVLVIDKNNKPGSKICAGGLRLSDISRLNIPAGMVAFKNEHVGTVTREDLFKCMIMRGYVY